MVKKLNIKRRKGDGVGFFEDKEDSEVMSEQEALIRKTAILETEWVVETIRNLERDMESGWRLNYYSDPEKTVWDIVVHRAKGEELHDAKIRQLADRYRGRLLRSLREKLQVDGDLDYMKRGVSWVYKYTCSWFEASAEEIVLVGRAAAAVGLGEEVKEETKEEEKSKKMKMVVFDVDYTVWPYDAHKDRAAPFSRENGRVYDRAGKEATTYPDVLGIMKELTDRGIPIAFASRNPSRDHIEGLLKCLEVEPNKSVWDLLPSGDYLQAYSSKGLYPEKSLHFLRLKEVSGIDTTEMLFFDDGKENIMTATLMGVKAVLVKEGLKRSDFERGMAMWK